MKKALKDLLRGFRLTDVPDAKHPVISKSCIDRVNSRGKYATESYRIDILDFSNEAR